MQIPLFPLATVLYPGGPLPLRIFEQRYLDMVSRCVQNDSPFGVLLIRSGNETGPADTYNIGTLARITDWYQGSDGLLGITATGEARFRLVSCEKQNDGLAIGEVELLAEESACLLPENYQPLAKILSGVLENLGKLYGPLEKHYDDASWVGFRFSEILPISPEQKQASLETDNPITRLEMLNKVLESVRS